MIYFEDELDAFAKLYFSKTDLNKHQHAQLNSLIEKSYQRYEKELDDEQKLEFKAVLSKFIKTYNYLTQLIPFENEHFLKIFVFGKRLYGAITLEYGKIISEDIDQKVDLAYLKILKTSEVLSGELEDAEGEVGGDISINIGKNEEDKTNLSIIIDMLNKLYGEDIKEEEFDGFFNQLVNDGLDNQTIASSAQANNYDDFYSYSFEREFMNIFVKRMEKNQEIVQKMMSNPELSELIKKHIAAEIYKQTRK
jgi:type I restriction enzyme R subunit